MSGGSYGREYSRRRKWLELQADISAYAETDEVSFVLEPCRVPAPCTVPVVPGNAAAARRAGCDDEYDNQIEAKYGDAY